MVTRYRWPIRANFGKRICCFEIVFVFDRLSARCQRRLRARRVISDTNRLGSWPSVSCFAQRERLQRHTEGPALVRGAFLRMRNPGAEEKSGEERGQAPPGPHNRSCHALSGSLSRANLALAIAATQCRAIPSCAKRNEYCFLISFRRIRERLFPPLEIRSSNASHRRRAFPWTHRSDKAPSVFPLETRFPPHPSVQPVRSQCKGRS